MNQQYYARKMINITMFGSIFLLFNIFICMGLIYFQIDGVPSFLSFLPIIQPISSENYLGGAYSIFITAGVLMVLYVLLKNREIVFINQGVEGNLKTLMLKGLWACLFFFMSYHLLFTNYLLKDGFYCGSVALVISEEICKGVQKPILDIMMLNLINFFYIGCIFSVALLMVFTNYFADRVE